MIYFVQFSDGTVKIGSSKSSKSLKNRFCCLKSEIGKHEPLRLIDGGFKEEFALHRTFDYLRIFKNRELFAPGLMLMTMADHPHLAVGDPARFCMDHWEKKRQRLSSKADGSGYCLVPNRAAATASDFADFLKVKSVAGWLHDHITPINEFV